MLKQSLMSILILILCYSCTEKVNEDVNSINGIWESLGSGWVLQIKDSTTYQIYDITSISCSAVKNGEFKEIEKSISLKNDTLSLVKGVITHKFKRIKRLSDLCTTQTSNKDPLYNFEVFAENVKAHYAFLELNTINWDSLYLGQKKKLLQNPTEIHLYQILEETLEALHDNHAYLEATEDVYKAMDTIAINAEEEKEQNKSENLKEYGDIQIARMVTKHHLQEEMTTDYASWLPLIQWGKINDEIGYIQVQTMWLYADLNISEMRVKEIGYVDAYVEAFHKIFDDVYIQKEVEAVSKIMDQVMDDLSKMKSIVIDVRFNGGGQDAVSFEILSRFIADKKLQVATQKLKYGNAFTPVLPLFIEGSENAYTKPVYILTSQQTGSAAEAFSIATMAIRHIKRIGSSTSGAMSTSLEKKLPNGWVFAISNEVYMDNDGNNYENIGIPVDYEMHYDEDRQTFFRSIADDLEADKKKILQAIKSIEEK